MDVLKGTGGYPSGNWVPISAAVAPAPTDAAKRRADIFLEFWRIRPLIFFEIWRYWALEPSLIGVGEVKLPLFHSDHLASHPRGSLASLRGRRAGRRMMGSGERGVPICFTTLQLLAGSRFSTGSPRPSSARERPGLPLRANCFCGPPFDRLRLRRGWRSRSAPCRSGTRFGRATCGAG